MRDHYFILDEQGEPKAVDVMTWAAWYEKADRSLRRTDLTPTVFVSTVFLGLDHGWSGGPPVLWETMAFGLDNDFTDRYTSREDALAGHEVVVALARARLEEAGQFKDGKPIQGD